MEGRIGGEKKVKNIVILKLAYIPENEMKDMKGERKEANKHDNSALS